MLNDSPLTATEIRDLRAFAGTMIPPSTRYEAPGADDEVIFADIVKSLGRDRADIGLALQRLAILAGAPSPTFPPSAGSRSQTPCARRVACPSRR
ncbi:hypothetical protein BH10PSE6_BH10PSE6_56570 [soil metagenome]